MKAAVWAEVLGTFTLVFAGTGAIMVDAGTGALGHLGISIAFGLVVMVLVYSVGHVSGAHLNPAVTLALASTGFFPRTKILPYILAQLSGAVLASGLLRITFGNVAHLGATLPAGNPAQALMFEALLTFILIFVIIGTAVDRRAAEGFAGLAIGGAVALDALIGGPISGASMNPARSFGPAIVSGALQYHWVYWVGPITGALLAAHAYRLLLCNSDQVGQ